jgi:hypothetical protein
MEKVVELDSGNNAILKYRRSYDFELGTVYVTDNRVIYHFLNPSDDSRLYNLKLLQSLTYGSEDIKIAVSQVIPLTRSTLHDKEGRPLFCVGKPIDSYPLPVLEGAIQTADFDTCLMWAISRLIKVLVVLRMSGLHYPGVRPDNVFVSAGEHTIFLPGYWWDLKEGNSDYTSEIAQIKGIAKSFFSSGAHREVLLWSKEPAESDPFEALERWDEAVDESVIVRKFVPLEVPPTVWDE